MFQSIIFIILPRIMIAKNIKRKPWEEGSLKILDTKIKSYNHLGVAKRKKKIKETILKAQTKIQIKNKKTFAKK